MSKAQAGDPVKTLRKVGLKTSTPDLLSDTVSESGSSAVVLGNRKGNLILFAYMHIYVVVKGLVVQLAEVPWAKMLRQEWRVPRLIYILETLDLKYCVIILSQIKPSS